MTEHLGVDGANIVVEHEDYLATVVVNELKRFGILGRTFLLVQFRAGSNQQLIEARVLPVGIVPRSVGSE